MSTPAKPNRTTYDVEFKKQAGQLVITGGRPLTQIARELGVSPWTLRDWHERFWPHLVRQPETLEAMRLRVARLERDNLELRQQRDILKELWALS